MRWLRLFLLLLLIPLAGCALNARPSTYLVEVKGPYALDTGDVVRVTVYGEPELTKDYQVNDGGAISLPLVGAIPVRGRTTQTAASAVTAALANGYLRDPSVAVEIQQYRPFFIQGAVKAAGQFPYVYGMTARAAISTAGGFSDTADRTRAIVYRRQGTEMVKGGVELDFPIYPGDTIVVLERWF
jgi:polysaccharide export outer membrane protein